MNTQLKKTAGSRHDPAADTHPCGHATEKNNTAVLEFVNSPRYERALWWLAKGVDLVPVLPNSKALVKGFGPYQDRIKTAFEASRWFEDRRCNLAVVCGSGPGLVCIDFDSAEAFSLWLSTHDIQTLVETSCKAGRGHLFFFDPDAANATINDCEVRARGRVVTVAPSAIAGARYGILRDHDVLRADIGELFPYSAFSPDIANTPFHDMPQLQARSGMTLSIRIKMSLPIVRYVSSLLSTTGKVLRPSGGSGRWWIAHCPFHDDQHPSFWIDANRGTFGCHASSCPANRGGDVINLHALRYGLSVKDAIADLAKELHL